MNRLNEKPVKKEDKAIGGLADELKAMKEQVKKLTKELSLENHTLEVENKKPKKEDLKLYAKIMINGIPFEKCLLDTASDVNMISTKMATKKGLHFKTCETTKIRGFNSQIFERVIGEMDVQLKLGPRGTEREVKFYVIPECPSPLVGMPSLEKFRLLIDTASHKLMERESGLEIICAIADLGEWFKCINREWSVEPVPDNAANQEEDVPTQTSEN